MQFGGTNRLLIADSLGYAEILDLDSMQPVGDPIGISPRLSGIALSPDGSQALCVEGRVLRARDPATRRMLDADPLTRNVPSRSARVGSLDDGRLIWVARHRPDGAPQSVINLVDDPSNPRVLRGHEHAIYTLAFDATGARLATGGWDGTVRTWNPATGAPGFVTTVSDAATSVSCMQFLEDNVLRVAYINGDVYDLDATSGALRGQFRVARRSLLNPESAESSWD